MEREYIISLVRYAVDNAYSGKGIYARTKQVLAIRGISDEEFGRLEEMYYCGMLEGDRGA